MPPRSPAPTTVPAAAMPATASAGKPVMTVADVLVVTVPHGMKPQKVVGAGCCGGHNCGNRLSCGGYNAARSPSTNCPNCATATKWGNSSLSLGTARRLLRVPALIHKVFAILPQHIVFPCPAIVNPIASTMKYLACLLNSCRLLHHTDAVGGPHVHGSFPCAYHAHLLIVISGADMDVLISVTVKYCMMFKTDELVTTATPKGSGACASSPIPDKGNMQARHDACLVQPPLIFQSAENDVCHGWRNRQDAKTRTSTLQVDAR